MPWIATVLFAAACTTPPEPVQDPSESQGAEAAAAAEPESRLTAETLAGLELRSLGPALMSGRIADIAVHPRDRSTWYVAVGSGGVWKTTTAGTTWTPIFDDQSSYSVGCVTIDPNHPEVVWVGTGEDVGGRHVGYGDGVYRSLDGGGSWERMGLEDSQHVTEILVDPRDSAVVYVAAQGPLWSGGGERGLYKSTDGGASWTRVLAGGEYTGLSSLVMDPRDPDVLYAATHQRLRSVAALVNAGPESGIHKSTDGGATWRELENGLPEEDLGKIGLAISPLDPDVVYATIELGQRKGGFWRSADGGASWEKRSDYLSGGTGPHYYQEIYASPHRLDRVYQADVRLHVTEDGGRTFREVGEEYKHGDNHAMAFLPDDPDYLLVGSDGGLYQSWDLGRTWKFSANLPVTQFYKVAVDDSEPFYNVYGGTQDNNTQGGPSRTDNRNGIRNADWFIVLFGDGHQPAVEPGNPDIVYAEWQEGNLCRYDRSTGELVYIQPQPGADEPAERFNWDAPILVSPHDPARLYYASQRVWRSADRGDSWRPISEDLSREIERLAEPLMGRTWSIDAAWDLWAMSAFGTITSLAESPLTEGLIYAGTDDGLIQVTEDGGATWRRVASLPGVADHFFVNDLKADLFDPDAAYVCVDQHKTGDFAPYLFKTTDRGRSWTSIAGDLPERHLVWRLVQDHVRPELLFLGTELGVFFTVDGGTHWVELDGGVPTIPFRDLAIQRREDDLVGATFGRGFYVLDDYSPLRELEAETLERGAHLFGVRDAWWYLPRAPLGAEGPAYQGHAYFVADNPPFGAVFTYYLRDGLETRAERRREAEKQSVEAGQGNLTPGWEALRREEREEEPTIVLTVHDASDAVVRRLTGPVTAGIHRVAWDLRHPSFDPWSDDDEGSGDEEIGDDGGFLAPPGTYTVRLARRFDGRLEDYGLEQTFEVKPLRQGALPGASPAEAIAFHRELEGVLRTAGGARAAVDGLLERVGAIQEALMRSTVDGAALDDAARGLEQRLRDLAEALSGNRRRERMGDPGPPSIQRRLQVATYGTRWSTYGPTPTHRQSLELGRAALAELTAELDGIVREVLPALEAELDAAGVPWTPGRAAPPLGGGR